MISIIRQILSTGNQGTDRNEQCAFPFSPSWLPNQVTRQFRWVTLCTYVIQTDYICQNLKSDFFLLSKECKNRRRKTDTRQRINWRNKLWFPHPNPSPPPPAPNKKIKAIQTTNIFCAIKPVQLKNQHFQNPIQSGTHLKDFLELISAPWVKKFDLQITNDFIAQKEFAPKLE